MAVNFRFKSPVLAVCCLICIAGTAGASAGDTSLDGFACSSCFVAVLYGIQSGGVRLLGYYLM